MDKLKKCPYCGKEYNAIRMGQITCGAEACMKMRNAELAPARAKKRAEERKNEQKKKSKQPENQQRIAEINEIALSLGLDYGLYEAYLYTGYLNTYLKIRFHNESAINADDRKVQYSWIGGGPAKKRVHEVTGCKV